MLQSGVSRSNRLFLFRFALEQSVPLGKWLSKSDGTIRIIRNQSESTDNPIQFAATHSCRYQPGGPGSTH